MEAARTSVAIGMAVTLSSGSLLLAASLPVSAAAKKPTQTQKITPPPPSPDPLAKNALPPPSPVPQFKPLVPVADTLPPPVNTRVPRPGQAAQSPASTSGSHPADVPTRVARPGQAPATAGSYIQPSTGTQPHVQNYYSQSGQPLLPLAPGGYLPTTRPGQSAAPSPSTPSSFSSSSPSSSSSSRSSSLPVPSPSPVPPAVPPAAPHASAPLASSPVKDPYPALGQLEQITFGSAAPAVNIDQRLAALENTIFRKSFVDDSLFDRTERLKKTILGHQEVDPNSAAGREEFAAGRTPSTTGGSDWIDNPHPALESLTEVHYLDEQAALPENMVAATPTELAQYAVVLINKERQAYGVAPITPDTVAEKLANDLTADLAKRNVLSHFDSAGHNPDRRFTLAEGADALNEGIASVKTADVGTKKLCKAAVARILKTMMGRQDDRDALLNAEATHLGFSAALSTDGERVFGAAEVLSRHAIMIPISSEVVVGDKVEVRGVLSSPYLFDKVTVAWEAYSPEGNASAPDESEEALPYFPPLDYVAYSSRSEGNHDKAIFALKTGLIVGAVAAGLFFPPAAMAVPLIALSGSQADPKPVSDIPVKSGIKVDGASFSGNIPLSNENKDGLYYVTVWAMQAKGQKSIPVSRRVILAKAASPDESKVVEAAEDKAKDERKEQSKTQREQQRAERREQERKEKEQERKEKEDRKLRLATEKIEKDTQKMREKSGSDKHEDKGRPALTVEGEVEPPGFEAKNAAASDSATTDKNNELDKAKDLDKVKDLDRTKDLDKSIDLDSNKDINKDKDD